MSNVPSALRPLQQQFVAARAERVDELRRLSAQAVYDAAAMDQLRMAFHKLAGSAGLLGFPKSGDIARKAEHLVSGVDAVPAALPETLTKLSETLEEEARDVSTLPDVPEQAKPADSVRPSKLHTVDPRLPTACIVTSHNSTTVTALCAELSAASFNPKVVAPQDAARACTGAAVALIDISAAGDGYALCREIASCNNAPLLRILFSDGNINFDLLKMSPSRAHRMIHRPFELRSVLRPEPSETELLKARILSVEDDPDYGQAIEAILKPAGHTVKVISRPDTVLEELAEFRPELLLLDWDLPNVNGHDLARIIRSDARHELLPIVFCTGRSDRRDRRAATRAGADDFITKPFSPEELLETIDTQLRRHRALRRRLDSDALTELLNRTAAFAALDDLLLTSRTRKSNVLVAILDIDHFKRVNDELGHPTGDRVLRETAAHLRANVLPGDVAGRLGGEELLLAIAGSDRTELLRRLNNIRESLHIELRSSDGMVLRKLAFSAGASWFPDHGTQTADLLKRADLALYEAKTAGRNRVVVAT